MRIDSPVDRRRWDQDPISCGSDGGETESEIGGSERGIDGREMPGVREKLRDRERGSRKGERTGEPSTLGGAIPVARTEVRRGRDRSGGL